MISSLLPLTEQNAVREQLNRILASHFFRNSKRFPDFLRYTVEHALDGDTEGIKERTLGIEVFGRAPDYDTSTDPVVRMTAAEVRKRLAQYYQLPGHEHEMRIDFPLRSYVPEFKFPTNVQLPALPPLAIPAAAAPHQPVRRWQLMALLLVCCCAVSAFLWSRHPPRENALDRFWGPVDGATHAVLLCIPDMNTAHPVNPGPASPDPLSQPLATLPIWFRKGQIGFADTLALARLTAALQSRGRAFYIRRADDVQLQDLQEGPVILIGGLTNQWTLQFGSNLRFSFIRDGDVRYISDRQNPSSRQWSDAGLLHDPGAKLAQDYGLISRIFDPTTGHLIISSAGILGLGTGPAAQCIADETCLEQAEKLAPGDWKHKNIQIVIATTIMGENAGQPRVVAAYVW